tara:strand:+ start:88 stop:795 length:708 start_codon:yes stop_codon:yes gene_type:complete
MRINPVNDSLMESVAETKSLLANRRIAVACGNRFTLTATVMTPAIAQSFVGGTSTEEEALEIISDSNPDLLIATEDLERGYGIRLVERVKKLNPKIKVLIFLKRETHEVVKEAMDAGADGVMFISSIGTGDGDFINALRTIAKGAIYYPQPVLNAYCKHNRPAPVLADPLSRRELDVISCLVNGMKNSEISEELRISSETVKSHVSSTISKLGVRDRTQAVVFALTHGLVESQLV